MDWQPIETAPKDGTRILGFVRGDAYGDETQFVIFYIGHGWSRDGDDYDLTVEPTHWMPLPTPPPSP